MRNFIILFLTLVLFLFSCKVSKQLTGISLTDENIQNYLKAYQSLRTNAPQYLEAVNQNPNNTQAQTEQYQGIEKSIQDSGLKSYQEFVLLNAKIGAVFSILQARSGMEDFKKMNEQGDVMTDEGVKTIQEQLDNPEVPEEAKVELRKAMKELMDAKVTRNASYQKNEKIASMVMKYAEKLTNMAVSEADINMVKKYESQIRDTYIGFKIPYEGEGGLSIEDLESPDGE